MTLRKIVLKVDENPVVLKILAAVTLTFQLLSLKSEVQFN